MNPGRFFIPNMGIGPIMHISPNLGINSTIGSSLFSQRFGLLNRITSSIKRINWNGLLSGANKTLNVVNQTIPLINQTRPMVNNFRNMIHLAKAFKNETNQSSNSKTSVNTYNNSLDSNIINNKKSYNENYPNFFI